MAIDSGFYFGFEEITKVTPKRGEGFSSSLVSCSIDLNEFCENCSTVVSSGVL